jgi:hypothetical protein
MMVLKTKTDAITKEVEKYGLGIKALKIYMI